MNGYAFQNCIIACLCHMTLWNNSFPFSDTPCKCSPIDQCEDCHYRPQACIILQR